MLTVRRILTNFESKSTCQCYPSHRLKKYYRKRQTTSENSIFIFGFSQSNNRFPRISVKKFQLLSSRRIEIYRRLKAELLQKEFRESMNISS